MRVRADGRIEMTHPLFSGAIHATASHQHRRRLHGELAEIASDVEERARHLMLMRASDDTDPHLAAILHDAAEHALAAVPSKSPRRSRSSRRGARHRGRSRFAASGICALPGTISRPETRGARASCAKTCWAPHLHCRCGRTRCMCSRRFRRSSGLTPRFHCWKRRSHASATMPATQRGSRSLSGW